MDDVGGRGTAGGDGIGESDDGQIRAVARAGRLVSLDLTARVMRRDPDEIGSSVRHAVNAALDHERHLVSERFSGVPGPDVVARVLTESQLEQARTGFQAGLLAETLDVVAEVRRIVSADGGPRTGQGSGSADGVRVTAGNGRVDLVEIAFRALQQQSRELADRVLTCVNSALDEAAQDAARDTGTTTDAGALGDRIAALREEWVRRVVERAGAQVAVRTELPHE